MHPDQVDVTPGLVHALLAAQHPRWADLPVTPVAEHGTDHALYRLGDDLCVRLPVYARSSGQSASDARWLPVLARHLPVAVPAPVALGVPAQGYPFPWSVVPWLPGRTPQPGSFDPEGLADDLADFVRALHAAPTDGGPLKAEGERGSPVRSWDDAVREAVVLAGERIDGAAALAAWEMVLAAPDFGGDPVWIHGDLLAGNLLVDEAGRLSAVIDFGALGLGDPAPDLQPAWSVLPAPVRRRFLDRVGYDDATVRRGIGWSLAPSLTGIPYYWDTVPALARRGVATLAVVLDELGISR